MAIKVSMVVVMALVLVASIQLPKANADCMNCWEACREQCLKINADSSSCKITCNNLCDIPNGAAESSRRSILMGGHFVDSVKGHSHLEWIKT